MDCLLTGPFFAGDIISVYLGVNVRRKSNLSQYAMDFSVLGSLDAKAGIRNEANLFLGCHFVNDRTYMDTNCDKSKKYNAKFVDLFLVVTSNIKKNTEILADYNIQYK